jgi:hypothetical protein
MRQDVRPLVPVGIDDLGAEPFGPFFPQAP